MIVTAGFFARSINSITDDDVRVSKRLYAPSARLRGFQKGSIGPVDGSDYVGGNYVATVNASSTVPYVLQTMENIDLKIFFDAGNVWGVDYDTAIDDSNKIRSSTGAIMNWNSPLGPMNFTLATNLQKASTDITESFRFNIGTSF